MCHVHNKSYPFSELRPPCATNDSVQIIDEDN